MTAIASTGRRLTVKRGEGLSPLRITDLAVTATKHVKVGGMVMLVAAGTCEPGAAGTGNVCLGVSQTDSDNTLSLSPAPTPRIETGIFEFFQTGTTITKSHIGTTVYMADDQTVTLSSSGNSPAGTCVGIGDDGTSVLVAISPLLPITSHGFAPQSATLTLTNADFVAGQGTGADTDGTARRYNFPDVLPAGAAVVGHMVHIVTAFASAGGAPVDTLSLSVGTVTPVDDLDTINALTPLVTTGPVAVAAGYTKGTLGDAPNSDFAGATYTGAQLTATLTPDGAAKISEITAGKVKITVWYLDGTDN